MAFMDDMAILLAATHLHGVLTERGAPEDVIEQARKAGDDAMLRMGMNDASITVANELSGIELDRLSHDLKVVA